MAQAPVYTATAVSAACTAYVVILEAMKICTREMRGPSVRLSTLRQFLEPSTLVTIGFNLFLSAAAVNQCLHPSTGLQQQLPFIAAGFGWAFAL
jgi:hypothetical protein